MADIPSNPSNTEPSPVPDKSRRSALLVVFCVMFIDLLGFGIVLPLLPRYGDQFVQPLFPKESYAGIHGAIVGALMASFSAMQFIFAPIWGRISDTRGRRPFLILGLVGSVVFYALIGLVSELGRTLSPLNGLLLLFVARIGAGIAGATVSTAQAVIADTTTPETRSRGMALIGVAFGIGFTFGPAIGFGTLELYPEFYGGPGFVAAGLSFLALIIAILKMPETWRPSTGDRHRGWLNLGAWRIALQIPTVVTLITAFFVSTLAFAGFETTLPLLTKDLMNYDNAGNLRTFVYVGFVLMLTQGGFYQMLARRGVAEMTFMLTGAGLMVIGFGGLAAINSSKIPEEDPGLLLTLVFFAILTVLVVGFAFVTPSVQALVSRRVDPAKQGQVLGVNQSANALSRILGPMAGGTLYYLRPVHVLPYVFSLMLIVAFLILALRVRRSG